MLCERSKSYSGYQYHPRRISIFCAHRTVIPASSTGSIDQLHSSHLTHPQSSCGYCMLKPSSPRRPLHHVFSRPHIHRYRSSSYDAEKETTLQDVMDGKVSQKIVECCGVAHREGYQWVWIDTCCIDKSGAELSEAINSMFACEAHDRFTDSKWFKRGWTLPELLAPQEVVFFDEDWNYIGTKGGLADKISEVTRIPRDALLDPSKCTHTASHKGCPGLPTGRR
ncbi:hypothetical protein A0H81_06086 [Grifola frondosa]|uniref:Heterokaryon incompatibility domain-containing protein n=1 Tax=Grifola frondosa TaxID=5627 RepID=A0A1C7M9K6_GRIFR|nr:hypothetical protein A0H81_06086 [Grifola frondosa]